MRIIVTRPELDAPAWVQGLSQRGHEVLSLPLIGLGPVSDPQPVQRAWADLAQYQAVMFVSGNAVKHFFALAPKAWVWPRATRAWATGPGTRAALLQAGVDSEHIDAPDAAAGQFDSEALWQVVGPAVKAGQRVLIVRGSDAAAPSSAQTAGVGRDWLAAQLQASAARVDFVVAYERCCPVWSEAQRQAALAAANDGSLWLFSSSEAVANLQRLLPAARWCSARAVATHARIVQATRAAGFTQVLESRPNLAAVAASIESLP